MALIKLYDSNQQNMGAAVAGALSTAQTGNGDSTNVLDCGGSRGPVLLKITTTIGATPTVTLNIQGSADNTNWFNVPYADSATPLTVVVAALVVTTATTTYKYVQANTPFRYLKVALSANTNVTVSIDALAFP